MTIDGNANLKDVSKIEWQTEEPSPASARSSGELDPSKISLRPMEVRTFYFERRYYGETPAESAAFLQS